jgi:hypothetical protein
VNDNERTILAGVFNVLAAVLLAVCVVSVWKNR